MKAKRLLRVFTLVENRYIEELYAEEAASRKCSPKRVWLIAAAVALMLLLVGCAVVYVLSLGDLKIGADTNVKDRNGLNERIEPTEVDRTVLTLHGFRGSSTYLAAKEWYEFRAEYDKRPWEERVELEGWPEKYEEYTAYNAYTQELIDKVDEICEKYDLQLLGPCITVQQWESDLFQKYLGIESVLLPDASAELLSMSGYFYSGGNFKAEFSMRMPKENGAWPYEMMNYLYYSKPTYFDDVYTTVEDIENCQQWSYTTQRGNTVLITVAADGYGAIVICDRDDALIYVNIKNYYNQYYNIDTNSYKETVFMTREQLEQVIDRIDFSIVVPETIDMRDEDPYAAYVETQLEKYAEAKDYQYALIDLNADGTEELVTRDKKVNRNGQNALFLNVHTIKEGKLQKLQAENTDLINYVCENGVLEYAGESVNGEDMVDYHEYLLCTENGLEAIEKVWWQSDWQSWVHKPSGQPGNMISEEKAKSIIASYTRIELDMIPFTEYPFSAEQKRWLEEKG